MATRLVRKIIGLPLKFVRRALQLWTSSQPEILPVGGLTPEASSELLFALRQAATTAEVTPHIQATPVLPACPHAGMLGQSLLLETVLHSIPLCRTSASSVSGCQRWSCLRWHRTGVSHHGMSWLNCFISLPLSW